MFLLNSRYPLFSLPHGTLSPEVTESFCRVPLVLLPFLPELTQPADLWQYLYDYCVTFSSVTTYTLHNFCVVSKLQQLITLPITINVNPLLRIEFFFVRLSKQKNHTACGKIVSHNLFITNVNIIKTYISIKIYIFTSSI